MTRYDKLLQQLFNSTAIRKSFIQPEMLRSRSHHLCDWFKLKAYMC